MYIQPELILEQYDVEVQQISKGRGNFFCETNRGSMVLTPYKGTERRAEVLRELLAKLRELGIEAEQILLTKGEKTVATDENGNHFILKDRVVGTECGTKSIIQMRAAAGVLAKLHLAFINDACRKLWNCDEPMPMDAILAKRIREMVKIKNYIKNKKSKSEFEILFQSHYEMFMENAKRAETLMQQCQPELEVQLCHGEFTQHNVVETSHGWQIVNYEAVCMQPACYDLANFLRKMLEKNDWDCKIGREILDSYCRVRQMTQAEWKALYALLLFPEKFRKIANHYMNSNKAWISGRDIEKLEQVIAKERSKERFMEMLFSFAVE